MTAASASKRPSAAGYWIGALILAAGGIGGMVWMFSAIFGVFGAVEHYPRLPVPGEATMSLKAGTYKLFAEYPGAGTDFGIPLGVGAIEVTGPDGEPLVVRSPQFHETYSWNGHEGRSVGEFVAPTTGSYHVKAAQATTGSSGSVQLTVGKGIDSSIAGQILGAIGVAAVGVLIGALIIIVTAVRRSRWKRQSGPPGFVGYGPPGGYPPGPYGPPGYGQPGYGPPGGYPPGPYGPPGYPQPGYGPTGWPAAARHVGERADARGRPLGFRGVAGARSCSDALARHAHPADPPARLGGRPRGEPHATGRCPRDAAAPADEERPAPPWDPPERS